MPALSRTRSSLAHSISSSVRVSPDRWFLASLRALPRRCQSNDEAGRPVGHDRDNPHEQNICAEQCPQEQCPHGVVAGAEAGPNSSATAARVTKHVSKDVPGMEEPDQDSSHNTDAKHVLHALALQLALPVCKDDGAIIVGLVGIEQFLERRPEPPLPSDTSAKVAQ